jgi:hypothetical protein
MRAVWRSDAFILSKKFDITPLPPATAGIDDGWNGGASGGGTNEDAGGVEANKGSIDDDVELDAVVATAAPSPTPTRDIAEIEGNDDKAAIDEAEDG